MLLPDDDTVELPPDDEDWVADESDPPALFVDDVLALLPGWARKAIGAPGMAVLEALRADANLVWARSSIAIGQQESPRFADAEWLDAWGELQHRPRAPLESDATYRARLMVPLKVVTPNAIRDVVETLVAVAGFAPNAAPVIEEVDDAIYCAPAYQQTGTLLIPLSTQNQTVIAPSVTGVLGVTDPCPWAAFAQPSATAALNKSVVADRVARLWAVYPDHPDGGVGAGAYLWPNIGAGLISGLSINAAPILFMVFIPGASDLSDTAPTCWPETFSGAGFVTDNDFTVGIDTETTQNQTTVQPLYHPDMTLESGANVVYGGYLASAGDSLGDQIIREAETRRAAGVGWFLVVDPQLRAAV